MSCGTSDALSIVFWIFVVLCFVPVIIGAVLILVRGRKDAL